MLDGEGQGRLFEDGQGSDALRRKYDETIFRAGTERMLGIRCEHDP